MILESRAYHPVSGLMPSLLRERIAGNGWYRERWATPYMARVAHVVFRLKPDVTLTSQLAPKRRIERLGPGGIMPLADITITPQPLPGKGLLGVIKGIIEKEPVYTITPQPRPGEGLLGAIGITLPMPIAWKEGEPLPTSPQTDLGARPEFGEWFKENRTMVIVISIIALILLFLFLKKGKR